MLSRPICTATAKPIRGPEAGRWLWPTKWLSTAFAGPALVGWITLAADSQRVGMAVIPVFFVVGLILLLPLREPG